MKSVKPTLKQKIMSTLGFKAKPVKTEHHTGKGTRARLNTAAERAFYGSKVSK